MKLSDAEAIFHQALELDSLEKRVAYVQSACGQDAELRSKVDRLLQAHERAGDFLQTRTAIASPLSEGPGTQIGKFKILEQIGEGGFGVVYMAEQKEPVRRRVALKIIKLGMDTKQVVARFEAERQALALMDHPNIAKVLDGGATETALPAVEGRSRHSVSAAVSPSESGAQGTDAPYPPRVQGEGSHSQLSTRNSQHPAGRPYFVMELVKGRPITKFCDEEKLSTAQRLELFIAVCHAIQHAHQKGLVHRDIKPSNILVSFVDGRPVPKIIDFGIAKAMQHDLTDKTVFTRFHQFMGTPAYMSPEQAGTDSADIDTRSDIYSLGAVLYELLTGRTPMDSREMASADYDEIRRRIREVEPMRPSKRVESELGSRVEGAATRADKRALSSQLRSLSTLLRGDLDWIVLKAMEKDRNRRYETANEFAKDIRRYLDSEPVAARKPSMGYVMQKFARRHKVALATAACFVLLLTVSACVSAAQAIKNKSLFTAAEEARLNELSGKERETELRRIAETERDRSQRFLYIAHMNLAKRAWDEANVSRVKELLDLQRPQPRQPDLRNFEWFYLDRLSQSALLSLSAHAEQVRSVAFSTDGNRLAAASMDKTNRAITVWNATSGVEIITWKPGSVVESLVFSPDGKWLASANTNSTVTLWDATNGQETFTFRGHTNQVRCVAFSSDGKRLASAGRDRTVKVWDSTSGQELLSLKGHTNGVNGLAFSADGQRLASASEDQTVKVWDAMIGREILTLSGHSGSINNVAFSPDGKRLASASWDETVKVWDATSGQQLLTFKGHTDGVEGVAFSPDGTRLASASWDQTIKVWDATTSDQILTLKGHTTWIYGVVFSPDGKRLASAGGDGTVKVWDATSVQEFSALKTAGRIDAFSQDGNRVASVWNRIVKVWDARTGRELLTLNGHSHLVTSVAFSLDGTQLASASLDRTIRVWDAASGQQRLTFKGPTNSVFLVAFSPDGQRLALTAGERSREVKVWDATSGQELLTLRGHTNGVGSVVFSPDGKRIASASLDRTVKIWDATSGQETLTLKGHTYQVVSVAFSPDGKRIACASWDGTVKVWDATSGQEMLTLKGHRFGVRGVAFSPDGQRLASAGDDRTVKVWDTISGQETLSLKGHTDAVFRVAFSPDGKRLVSAGRDGTVKVWDAQPRSEARTPEAKTR